MNKFLIALSAVLAVSGCTTTSEAYQKKSNDYVIRHDLGGVVAEYKVKAASMKGRRIVIDGKCYSSCMFYVSSLSSGRYCATDRADLGFHGIFYVGSVTQEIKYEDDIVEKSRIGSQEFVNILTPKVRARLKKSGWPSVYKGDPKAAVEHIKGREAIALLGKC